ncbi:DUF881 domain-containing protein [Hathewaya histolytica]|uniref:Division initiation protein n=1 Tax=Hathewaya histolytica TaxID=1498 RepID=A0A4U9RAK1_HATHI|nr:DUF881 domain-containing protein [Hathewaya histolytica]VTQ87928.1 division initiation protein [Hathewaya histolytica]
MKKNEATVFVFIASVIIGILISMNLNFGEKNKVFLNIDQYNEAYNKRNKLYKDITILKQEANEYNRKLGKYENEKNNVSEIKKDVSNKLEEYKNYMGLNAMEGEGVKIMLNDATASEFEQYYSPSNLIHDIDIWFLINDLRSAGAEAIAINGQRIVNNTYSYCSGTFIEIKGSKIVAPFYIDVIGNKNTIKEYLLKESLYMKSLTDFRKITVKVSEANKVEVPAFEGDINFKYAYEKSK